MNDSIQLLQKRFLEIKHMGWIRSLSRNTNGIGYTFEKLLGKEPDEFNFPDFYGIEIKTKHHFSKGFLSLFNLTPDGDFLFPMEHVRENYGYPDRNIPSIKVFQFSIKNNSVCQTRKYSFQLKVDYALQKVILIVFNKKGEIADSSITWSFSALKVSLYRKLTYLAMIEAKCKKMDQIEYFNYYKLSIYKCRNFENFLHLIETGKIKISFKLGVFKSGRHAGKLHDHGTSFDIHLNDLLLLFKPIA